MNRRHFLGRAASGAIGILANSRSKVGFSRQIAGGKPEWIMLVWCAHSISGALRLNLKFDREYVRQMIAHCADHGVRSILWCGSYVGKLTYHSKVG